MMTKTFTSLACVSLLSLLAACGPNPDGYYDGNGNFIRTSDTPHNVKTNAHPYATDSMRRDRGYYDDNHYNHVNDYNRDYDRNGYTIPQDMLPPRGMCRVWFTQRSPSDQPKVESCNGIKSRVPAGAYVIFGG